MKKTVMIASALVPFVASIAYAGNINNNPLYMPAAGVGYGVTDLGTDTDFETMTAEQTVGFGITDNLTLTVGTSVWLFNDEDDFIWDSFSLGAEFRVLDKDGWKGDLIGDLTIYGDDWHDKDYNLYLWNVGVRGGYAADNWTLAGLAQYGYVNTEAFNWDEEGVKVLSLGVAGQYIINSSWNVTGSLIYEYYELTDDYNSDDNALYGTLGVNYNINDDMFLGVYASKELIQDNDDDEVSLGIKFGFQF